jgi:hypothetical protein
MKKEIVMFVISAYSLDYKYMTLIRVGAMALVWSLWLCRNDKVFINIFFCLLQVFYKCTGTLRLW